MSRGRVPRLRLGLAFLHRRKNISIAPTEQNSPGLTTRGPGPEVAGIGFDEFKRAESKHFMSASIVQMDPSTL